MRYTIPQKVLLEMDERLRGLERSSQGDPGEQKKYIRELLRSGNLDSAAYEELQLYRPLIERAVRGKLQKNFIAGGTNYLPRSKEQQTIHALIGRLNLMLNKVGSKASINWTISDIDPSLPASGPGAIPKFAIWLPIVGEWVDGVSGARLESVPFDNVYWPRPYYNMIRQFYRLVHSQGGDLDEAKAAFDEWSEEDARDRQLPFADEEAFFTHIRETPDRFQKWAANYVAGLNKE